MQVNETLKEGLKRELDVIIPADELDTRLVKYLEDLKDRIQIPGFRPGKVPLSHLKRVYGQDAMKEIINETVGETVRSSIDGRDEKPALQPDVDIANDTLENVIKGGVDLAFKVVYEVLPEFELGDFKSIKIERPITDVIDADIDQRIDQIAESNRPFASKDADGVAADGDRLTMSYVGKIDGEPFEGGADENGQLVLGSGQFIPGFEDQLIGAKAGEQKVVKVAFPEDYPAEHLAGKDAEFGVTVKDVETPEELTIDDAWAERFGIESLAKFKEAITQQIESEFGSETRQQVKRQLLDQLDEMHEFELPPTLLESEFEQIWNQLSQNMTQACRTFEDEDTTEEKAREEYRKIAERRVRLGLVLSEIGEKNNISVTDAELQRAPHEKVSQYPGHEKQVFEFYEKNPNALASLRAPIYEDKAIDFIIELADVTDKKVTKEELFADSDDDE